MDVLVNKKHIKWIKYMLLLCILGSIQTKIHAVIFFNISESNLLTANINPAASEKIIIFGLSKQPTSCQLKGKVQIDNIFKASNIDKGFNVTKDVVLTQDIHKISFNPLISSHPNEYSWQQITIIVNNTTNAIQNIMFSCNTSIPVLNVSTLTTTASSASSNVPLSPTSNNNSKRRSPNSSPRLLYSNVEKLMEAFVDIRQRFHVKHKELLTNSSKDSSENNLLHFKDLSVAFMDLICQAEMFLASLENKNDANTLVNFIENINNDIQDMLKIWDVSHGDMNDDKNPSFEITTNTDLTGTNTTLQASPTKHVIESLCIRANRLIAALSRKTNYQLERELALIDQIEELISHIRKLRGKNHTPVQEYIDKIVSIIQRNLYKYYLAKCKILTGALKGGDSNIQPINVNQLRIYISATAEKVIDSELKDKFTKLLTDLDNEMTKVGYLQDKFKHPNRALTVRGHIHTQKLVPKNNGGASDNSTSV